MALFIAPVVNSFALADDANNEVHVQLNWKTPQGSWEKQRFAYKDVGEMSGGSASLPALTTEGSESVLAESSATFNWVANGTAVRQWWVYVGSVAGGAQYLNSGRITDASTRSLDVTGLPVNASTTPADASTAPASRSVDDSSSNWANTVQPPELVNPLRIEIGPDTPLTYWGDHDRVGCEGLIYRFAPSWSKDVIVTMHPDMDVIKYPVWVEGGRNVRLVGLEMRPKVQEGCGVGQAHQVRDYRANIHPRLVGNKAFQLKQAGTTWLEGIDVDLMGQEADCFVSRNPDHLSRADVKANRNFYIVNSRCVGIEGLDKSPIGDGVHGDFFQNQGRDDLGSLVIENATYRTSSNGVTLHAWGGESHWPRLFSMRNVDYGWDLRYSDDSRYETFGLAFTGSADRVVFENVWLNHGKGLDYGFVNGERIGATARSGYIKKHSGLSAGASPTGEFATAAETGRQYTSSF